MARSDTDGTLAVNAWNDFSTHLSEMLDLCNNVLVE